MTNVPPLTHGGRFAPEEPSVNLAGGFWGGHKRFNEGWLVFWLATKKRTSGAIWHPSA
jgi:hypothetical protein